MPQHSWFSFAPPEIWIEIFEWASFVPGLMDIDLPNTFEHPTTFMVDGTAYTFRVHDLKASLLTRKALVLVCKDWYSMAMPLLYQCLVVRSVKDAECLCLTLNKSRLRTEEGHGDSALGSYTRHLVVRSRERSDLSEIIPSLPNLQILSFSLAIPSATPSDASGGSGDVDPLFFLRAVLETCGNSLQRISATRLPYSIRCDIDAFTKMCMTMAPQLRTLITPDVSVTRDLAIHSPVLPSLMSTDDRNTEVSLDASPPSSPSEYDFVSVFEFLETRRTFLEKWSPFFSAHGSHLTTVHLRFDIHCRAVHLSMLRIHCPNLRLVVLYFKSVPNRYAVRDMPPVLRVGIHFGDIVPAADFLALSRMLSEMNTVPGRVVRFLHPQDWLMFQAYMKYMEKKDRDGLVHAITTGSFHLEDHNGDRLWPSMTAVTDTECIVRAYFDRLFRPRRAQ
ncbi:hypothetical protein BV25DRAFT_690578 [Artomyces pyxidatus]|uniref:Uncharacterized protein n=1 Tax=Artomyces pyxidatus TaxID=48021 RepID=A0ACB8T024_9AGAM|nr:hypothetical protein BV25DRAFT_690578 [Artomyces pyxidatus]